MSSSAAKDVVDAIDGSSAIALTKGSSLFWGPIRAKSSQVAVNSLFVMDGDGPEPMRFMGQVSEIQHPMVHMRLRWKLNGAGSEKAHAIRDFMQALSISGYLDVKALGSGPNLFGQDDDGNHLWTMSFELTREETK